MTKHTPAIPLPWGDEGNSLEVVFSQNPAVRSVNESYIAHAANAYPKMVEALRLIVMPDSDGFAVLSAGNKEGKVILALLRSLGEL